MKRVLVIGVFFVVGLVPLVGVSAGYDPTALLGDRLPSQRLVESETRVHAIPASLHALFPQDVRGRDTSALAESARIPLSPLHWLLLAGCTALIGVSRRRLPR